MLQAAVHSMYMRDGSGPASSGRSTGASSLFSGSLSGQSPQNREPPWFSSSRSRATAPPFHTSRIDDVRASPSTRRPYGSAQPHTRRPSQSMTSVLHGHEHWKRGGRKLGAPGRLF